jgi:phenylpropionate dioxygenase-like ring-hydroxylating dioxygenase large terminal subunit
MAASERRQRTGESSSAIDYREAIQPDRVHGSLYVAPGVFEDEMTRIFARGWAFVGHESEVPEAGDWVTRRVAREPLILVRDSGGAVHVLANRCAHRGTALCWSARGKSRAFVCTYHGWTFSLAGELRGVPNPGGFHRSKTDLGLDRPGQVDAYRGFVFANLDGNAGPLDDHLGAGGKELIDRMCDLSPTGKIQIRGGWIGHRISANWKMLPESDNDGYHLRWVHASMVASAPDTYYEDAVLGTEQSNPSRAVDHGGGHVELDFRPSYREDASWLGMSAEKAAPYFAALESAHGAERARQLLRGGPPHAMIFPNLFLGEMNLAIVEPVAPGVTIHHHTAIQLEGVEDSFNQRLLRQSEAALGPASFIVPDDAVTAERMQHAFANGAASVAAGTQGSWIDLSRGLERERVDPASGDRVGHVTDETTNRGFWRRYRELMTSGS